MFQKMRDIVQPQGISGLVYVRAFPCGKPVHYAGIPIAYDICRRLERAIGQSNGCVGWPSRIFLARRA